MKISDDVAKYSGRLSELRRKLHKMPELSREEFATADFIEGYLKKLRPDKLTRCFNTGLKAVFFAKNAEKTIGLRADIDALPVTEDGEKCSFASKNEGKMHACGHDGHTAIMMAMAALVAEKRDELKYNIVFIFQPAEETDGGAQPMIEEGVLEDPHVDEIFGLHIWPYIEAGKIGLKAGPLMSHMRDLNVDFYGREAHGARPHNGVDAMMAAAAFINQVQTIISRNVDPVKTAVITLGVINGGEARNIVCDHVHIEGTVRTFEKEVSERVKTRILEIIKGIETGLGVRAEYYETMTFPAVMNDEALVERARELLFDDERLEIREFMMSEDFSFYQEQIPGLFVFLGTGEEGHNAPLHSAQFSFDEKYLSYGMEFFARVIGLA